MKVFNAEIRKLSGLLTVYASFTKSSFRANPDQLFMPYKDARNITSSMSIEVVRRIAVDAFSSGVEDANRDHYIRGSKYADQTSWMQDCGENSPDRA